MYYVSERFDVKIFTRLNLPEGVEGICDTNLKAIGLSRNLTYAAKRCALVHELVHYLHDDGKNTPRLEARTRRETAEILVSPETYRQEEEMYGTDYAQIADDMDITESVLADYLRLRGVPV